MRAVTWHQKRDVSVSEVPDLTIEAPTSRRHKPGAPPVGLFEVLPECGAPGGAPDIVAVPAPVVAPTTIRSYPDGPLLVRGSFVLEDAERGAIPITRSVIALCRCGRSKAAPMCDGSHRARRSMVGASESHVISGCSEQTPVDESPA